jgi:hypothetical protein
MLPPMNLYAALPAVFTYAQAIAAGYTRHQITNRRRTGRWLALRRGVYCCRETLEDATAGDRLVLHAAAARAANPSAALVDSHITAAARWSLPMPLPAMKAWAWPKAALTDGDIAHSTRIEEEVVIQVATLWPGEVRQSPEGPLTAPARTAADCLRHYGAEIAVPIADAAIQGGLTTARAVAEVLARQATWPYAGRASHSLPLVDGRRETWLESVSAVRLWAGGIELAEPQVEIYDAVGTFVARVDFLWPGEATVGEADGAGKYAMTDWPDLAAARPDDLREAQLNAVRRVVRQEKAREDALRELGLEVVRWSTAELLGRTGDVVRRVARARARGDARRFTGQVRARRAA